ncbi:hypothetical protein [Haloarcula amylovorans]|uniref:hypothetical protein n=1 Tax=Haloarcula amylovorans TaxID=2562280 RepID=UPI001076B0E6|nr:hypothetical protein [Halomicroarcula amylolytica]
MGTVPDRFTEEFANRGETFFELAAILYANHGHQYTLDALTEHVDVSKTRVSELVDAMVAADAEWVNKTDGQMTVVWNTEAHNPAATESADAVSGFYRDLWRLLKTHSNTAPGTFAIMGFLLFVAAVVVFAFYIGFSLSITQDSAIPTIVYLVIAGGSFLTGVIVTALSPLQAFVNSVIMSRLPATLLGNTE